MKARNNQFGSTSLRFNLLFLMLSITLIVVTTLTLIAVGAIQSLGSSAQNISSDALSEQARGYLQQITNSTAKENALVLERVMKDAEQLAAFTAAIFDHPDSFNRDQFYPIEAHVTEGEDGQYLNSKEDISSLFLPNTTELTRDVMREVELSAYLDLIFESVFSSNPNTDAIYFATESDMTRYYPNIGLGLLVPSDFAASKRPWYLGSLPGENPERATWLTPVYEDATGLGLITTVATPVYNRQGTLIGVVGIDIKLSEMTASIEQIAISQRGYSFLIDNTGQAVALSNQGYQHILGRQPNPDEINTDLTASTNEFSPLIAKMMAGMTGLEEVRVGNEALYVAYAPLENTGWSLGSVVPVSDVLLSVSTLESELAVSTQRLLLTIVLPVSLGILLLAILLSLVMTNRVATPVQQLAKVAEQLQAGQFDIQIPKTNQKEIGALAQAFKSMADQIHQMILGLEQRVAERTQEMERRTIQLQVAAEVARDATSTRQMDVLLHRAVNLVRERFGFYHAGIFLIDARGEYALLHAATGEAGAAMLAAEHKLKVGEVGIVGYVTSTGRPRISLDVGADAVHFRNPHLPKTRSEMALPLKVGPRTIGALDVQSELPSAFDQEDITILQVLADQLAIAIDNARLFKEAQDNLQQIQALYGQYNEEAWQRLERVSNISGYQFDESGISPLLKQADSVVVPADMDEEMVRVPLQVRGQMIGTLDVWPERKNWTPDETNMLQALGERISQAMESARLYEETQARVAREQILNQMGARFTHSLDFETLLQTAVLEIGQLPNIAEVSIHVGAYDVDSHETRTTFIQEPESRPSSDILAEMLLPPAPVNGNGDHNLDEEQTGVDEPAPGLEVFDSTDEPAEPAQALPGSSDISAPDPGASIEDPDPNVLDDRGQ